VFLNIDKRKGTPVYSRGVRETMSMGMEVGIFLAYAFGALMVYVFGRFFLVPLKWILGALISSLLGGVAIMVINILGTSCGLFIPLNVFTVVITGVLGVPGLIMLVLFFI
jgi:inhibitor of the pro-sigma K processing machinery